MVKKHRRARKKRKNGAQLNAVVPRDLFAEFKDFCKREGRFRDRTVERALRMFLRAEDREQDREFYVTLAEDAARRFMAFRTVRRYPAEARSGVVETALDRHIETALNPAEREAFAATLDQIQGSQPN